MLKDQLQPTYVITQQAKEVYSSLDLDTALKEFTKQKYLLGYKTVSTKLKDEHADAKIAAYIDSLSDISELDPNKASRVLVDRVHSNTATKKRLRLMLVYKPNSPEAN